MSLGFSSRSKHVLSFVVSLDYASNLSLSMERRRKERRVDFSSSASSSPPRRYRRHRTYIALRSEFCFLLDKKDKQIRTAIGPSMLEHGTTGRQKFSLVKNASDFNRRCSCSLRAGFGFGFCRRDRCAERTRIDPPWRECERGVATESPSPSPGVFAPKNGNV